jgi:hypothetical protein
MRERPWRSIRFMEFDFFSILREWNQKTLFFLS